MAEMKVAAEEYNGWTNRETWALNLHITNDQGLDEMARERVAGLDTFRAAEALREWVENDLLALSSYEEEYGTPPNRELLMMAQDVGSVWRVDWIEIAKAFEEE